MCYIPLRGEPGIMYDDELSLSEGYLMEMRHPLLNPPVLSHCGVVMSAVQPVPSHIMDTVCLSTVLDKRMIWANKELIYGMNPLI